MLARIQKKTTSMNTRVLLHKKTNDNCGTILFIDEGNIKKIDQFNIECCIKKFKCNYLDIEPQTFFDFCMGEPISDDWCCNVLSKCYKYNWENHNFSTMCQKYELYWISIDTSNDLLINITCRV